MIQVHERTSLDIVSGSLNELMALPDPEAADALNTRFSAWVQVEKRSYVERGIICREFDRRELWRHLIDPDTGIPFPNFTAWMSCSLFLGCRRTNFEAKADVLALTDVPDDKLIGIDKDNIKVLKKLSTQVRNDPKVLEAARTLPCEEFESRIERHHPDQHLERRVPMYITPGRSERKVIDKWIEYCVAHDIAASPTEAIVRACERCLLDEELNELHPVPDEVTHEAH